MTEEIVQIGWREAEQLCGCRLDRRVAYWRKGDRVLVYPHIVNSLAELREAEKLYPGMFSGHAFDRPVVERPYHDGRLSLADLVEI